MPPGSNTVKASDKIQTDITIIGGGIAGLWLLHRLCSLGYNAILLEHKALGSDHCRYAGLLAQMPAGRR